MTRNLKTGLPLVLAIGLMCGQSAFGDTVPPLSAAQEDYWNTAIPPKATTPTVPAKTATTSVKADSTVLKPCTDAQATNAKACGDPNSTAGMGGSEQAQLLQGLGMVSMIGAQAAAARGSANACMLASTLSATIQMMSLLKANACQKTITSCDQVCSKIETSEKGEAETDTVNAAEHTKTATAAANVSTACLKNNAAVAAMQGQMLMLGMTAMNALNCKSNSSDTAALVATPIPLTTAVGDCSDASFAATNTYCICQANPSDALCTAGAAGVLPGSSGLATGGVTTPAITTPGVDDGQIVDTTPVGGKGQNGTVAGGGAPGGGGFGSSPPGGLNPEGSDGTGASGIDKNVIVGASGSGGGGLSPVGGGGGGGGSRGGGSGSGGGGSSFNLAKYLPKNLFQNRGLAGMTVPAQDGVTGPLGPSIWEKVHTRYEDKKATLIQDK